MTDLNRGAAAVSHGQVQGRPAHSFAHMRTKVNRMTAFRIRLLQGGEYSDTMGNFRKFSDLSLHSFLSVPYRLFTVNFLGHF